MFISIPKLSSIFWVFLFYDCRPLHSPQARVGVTVLLFLPGHNYVSVTHKGGFDFIDPPGPLNPTFVRAIWLGIIVESLFFALTSAASSASFAGRSLSVGRRAARRGISRQFSAPTDLVSRNRFLVAFWEFRENGSFSAYNAEFCGIQIQTWFQGPQSRFGLTNRSKMGSLLQETSSRSKGEGFPLRNDGRYIFIHKILLHCF
jgi:hypothetical protein